MDDIICNTCIFLALEFIWVEPDRALLPTGRPWFRLAKIKQDWGLNVVVITKGKKQVTIPMKGRRNILANEIEDDEEEEFLKENPTVVPVLEVDVEALLAKDDELKIEQQEKEVINLTENIYEQKYASSGRVKEDELQEINLGMET
ncbi:hypothetical protein KP509_1Z306100 [Ceratopteris richardii]|nr:hypothetical protein KP509_1Z306100 [Ceratopteris richardii]